MDVKLFDYTLPEELIAQTPLKDRKASRMLVVHSKNKTYTDQYFYDIVNYFNKGDVLVRNNTKVIPARLFGIKNETQAKVELLLLTPLENDTYECIVGNAKVVKAGTTITFLKDVLSGECVEVKSEGRRVFRFKYSGQTLLETLEIVGETPLPPYIHEKIDDPNRYQTIYARVPGSSAAPTAGFHFTKEIDQALVAKGVRILEITLHVGLGTFRPVKVERVEDHVMHYEHYEISDEVANELNAAKKDGRRIIAVGTTSLRCLEANFIKHGKFTSDNDATNLFITPGVEVRSVDGLLTNFHLPQSTLLMLVSAIIGREFCLDLYNHAIREKYRFFSFGDCMLIL